MVKKDEKIHLTKEGLEGIKKEYNELLNIKRPKLVERLAESRQMGDLAENNEYIQARQELAFVDGRISELESVINKVEVIKDNKHATAQVGLGCKITVKTDKGEEKIFWLVGEWEADPLQKKISCDSPLGKSLLGKKKGEKVEVAAPAGKIVYIIVKIE